MRAIAILALVAGSVLAGCSGSDPEATSEGGPTFDDLGLQATSSTGVIRGVVVDDAIRPIAGANVALTGDAAREATSTAAGTFGFDDLEPGTYFLSVSKLGYLPTQQSADVVAGVAEPPIVKVQLMVDAANLPYVASYVFSGFTECMTTVFQLCGFLNDVTTDAGLGNQTHDNTQTKHAVDRVPTWVQSEMVWSSTQALGGTMSLMYSWTTDCPDSPFLCDHDVEGTSPLLLTADAEDIAQIHIGDGEDVYIRTFTGSVEGTVPAGLTLQQSFDVYTHVFYGYQPPEGWRFSDGGDVPQPAT